MKRGDEVLVNGDWYPIIGIALVYHPDKPTTGSVFTLTPIGRFEPCLGYRIDYTSIEAVRPAGRSALQREGE
jgi:hypothetical protein